MKNNSTEQDSNAHLTEPVLSDAEQPDRLRAELAEVCQALSEERASLLCSKKEVEGLCAQLLKLGERIPALDQPTLSLSQQAYLSMSTTTIIASEKILILQNQIACIEVKLTQLAAAEPRQYSRNQSKAA